jgi:hypothetical protein
MANWALFREQRHEWPIWKVANRAVVIALTFGGVAGFGAASLWWSATTTMLRERVAYWQERAQNNPTTRTDRHLSDDERVKLISALKPLAESIQNVIVSVEGVPEAVRYSTEFIKILKDVGANPIGPVFAWSEKDGDRGVMVGLAHPSKPSELAIKFIDVLKAAGFDIRVVQWRGQVSRLDFDLFIGDQ